MPLYIYIVIPCVLFLPLLTVIIHCSLTALYCELQFDFSSIMPQTLEISFERVLTESARSAEQLDSFNQKSRLILTQNLCGSHRTSAISDFVFVLLFNLHSVFEVAKKR